ncbi:MAG: universal stress protein [Oleiphilaceae bacterium]|nr:universal stress protein [Oleiphilaceae bacterium]
MSMYQSILVAVECSKGAQAVLKKAAQVQAANPGASLSIVHVVLDLIIADWAGSPGQIPPPLDQEELAKSGAEYLKPQIEAAGLDPNTLVVCFGHPAQTILKQAENCQADLIVAGSHSRHGLEVLLGSTAHKILNLAECDVLLVRIPKD